MLYQNDDAGREYLKAVRDALGPDAERLLLSAQNLERRNQRDECVDHRVSGSGQILRVCDRVQRQHGQLWLDMSRRECFRNVCDSLGANDVQHHAELYGGAKHLQFFGSIHGEAAVRSTNIWRDQRGASAVEFALVAPVFFLMIFGIVAVGFLFWTQVGLPHGAEMAARCATANPSRCPTNNSGAITSYAKEQALGLPLPASTFTYSMPACGNQVSATYTFAFPDILNLGPLTITAQSCFPA
jgi:hypothetical protein